MFGVPLGKLLGFIASEHGIEINPEIISTIMDMEPVNNLKGAQRLTGCLADLSRFVSWLKERGMPLYKLLKKSERFMWTQEAQEAFDRLKSFLTTPPVLTSPSVGETLLLYTTGTTCIVSVALVVEQEEEGQSLKI